MFGPECAPPPPWTPVGLRFVESERARATLAPLPELPWAVRHPHLATLLVGGPVAVAIGLMGFL